MKIWALTRANHKIAKDIVQEFPGMARPESISGWTPVLDCLCRELDLSRPVILEKNLKELSQFARTVFRAEDFMEPVSFDRFEIEIFPEEKKK